LYFIGDIHGDFGFYESIVRNPYNDVLSSIQIGDFGIGFGTNNKLDAFFEYIQDEIYPYHKFIRGNHDNPKVCQLAKNYLGDWGYLPSQGLFYAGGAWSIDKHFREENRDWWADEQLSIEAWDLILEEYAQIKPDFMITHDAPADIYSHLGINEIIKNLTANRLNQLFYIHSPKIWVFGHHHIKFQEKHEGTEFHCIDINEVREIPEIPNFN
jgi:hypothetical protein